MIKSLLPAVSVGLALSWPVAATQAESNYRYAFRQIDSSVESSDLYNLHLAALKGDHSAQTALGKKYHLGLGVKVNPAEAAKWYRKAANQGDAEAQFSLGILYLKGIGVTEDYHEGFRYISQAARQDHPEAMKIYNFMLSNPNPMGC